MGDAPDGVDVPGDHVTAHAIAEPERPLEVDAGAGAELAERRAHQRLRPDDGVDLALPPAVTVKQPPSTASEAPSACSSSSSGAARSSARLLRRQRHDAAIRPTSSTIPVNISTRFLARPRRRGYHRRVGGVKARPAARPSAIFVGPSRR